MPRIWNVLPHAVLVLGIAAHPVVALEAPCRAPLDPVLTVGWPLGREAEIPRLTEKIARFHRDAGRCPERTLQVNLAFGTDYELLAWISTGAVDAALLSPLGVDLARRDGVELRPVETWRETESVLEPAGTGFDEFLRRVDTLGEEGAASVFLTVPSHLSNEFYRLLEEAGRFVEERNLGREFWRKLFAHLCFRPRTRPGDVARPCVLLPPDSAPAPVELALALTSRPSTTAGPAPPLPDPRPGGRLPEWLAVRPDAAEKLFALAGGGGPAFPELWPRTKSLLDHPPAPELRDLALADPRLGTRGFGFTIGEALGLLDAHARASGRPRLALVLPGGGVKAAYQTTLLDALYGQRLLRNRQSSGYGEVPERVLDVDLVTGTSGGALVGYFVSRLGSEGPFDLTCRLWFGGPGCPRTLDHNDVFPPADMLRYLSLVVVFVLFSITLSLFALRRRSPFALENNPPAPSAAGPALSRPLLALSATALLAVTPFAVRFVNGEDHLEHIPDVEGFVYLLLALLAMFVDQCLVARPEGRSETSGRLIAAVTLGAGTLAFVPPLVAAGASTLAGWSDGAAFFALPTPFWAAFALLAPIFGVPLVLGRNRSLGRGTVPSARDFLVGSLEFLVVAWVTLALYANVAGLRSVIEFLGPFLVGLVSVLTLVLFLLRPPDTSRATSGRHALHLASLAVACLGLIALARPARLPVGWRGLAELGQAESMLGVKLGSLAVTVGALLLLGGTLFALAAWRPRYRLENTREFATGLAVCLGHALVSFGLVWLAAKLGWVSLFELTLDYWLALGVVALALAIGGILAAALFARGWLRSAFGFLASAHPNGRFRVRRHVRMVHFAVFAWGFWNLILAPALYGNEPARRYLEKVALDFCAVPDPKSGECRVERPFTAPLLVPANSLDGRSNQETGDGSRFFLILPEASPCPTIPRNPAGGGRWHVFHTGHVRQRGEPREFCVDLDSPAKTQGMIFASGSPFPVFPAHGVTIPGARRREYLVDGGYSNNVPIAPGQNLGIEAVLVVDSANPLAGSDPSELGRLFAQLVGSLVDNVLQLPGYLFGRAQVLDLQSRRDFFVVRIAPHESHEDWPFLADFRAEVVEDLRDAAKEDLERRIARVESWGKPRFVWSWRTGR